MRSPLAVPNDIKMTYNQKQEALQTLAPFIKLHQQWPKLILGGSLALIIQDAIPYRKAKDIDLVGHRYNVWDKQEIYQLGSSVDDADCVMIKIDGVAFDYFIKPSVIYSVIDFMGILINVQYTPQIISAKLQYYNKHAIVKHRDDLVAYFEIKKNGYKEQEEIISTVAANTDDDLPF